MAAVARHTRRERAAASPRGGRPGGRRPAHLARWLRVLCLGLLVAPALIAYRPDERAAAVRQAADPWRFDLVGWQVAQLRERLPGLLRELVSPPAAAQPITSDADIAAVRAYMERGQAWRRALAGDADEASRDALRAAWEDTREPAARALAASLAVLASKEGLTTRTPLGEWLLPPASFVLAEPPRVLVVSPRDRIEVSQSVLLLPNTGTEAAETMEDAVGALGESGLVVEIGGIATYPAMVPFQGRPLDVLSATAHEWTHGWLIFQPLGRAWFATPGGRQLNETVAELVGRELGARLAEAYGFPVTPPPAAREPADPAAAPFNFRQEMRATRERLDALLAAGEVDAAEAYLATRREDFVAAGYRIRKLNQAYFAFHGNYAESGAAISPLETEVRALREQSPSLAGFLRRVGALTDPAEVTAALAAAPAPANP